MRRNAGTRHSGTTGPTDSTGSVNSTDSTGPTGPDRHPGPAEVVALVNGVTASIAGTYVVTSSVLLAALAGVLAVVVATVVVALHLRSGR
ncbi:hypothetical protein Q3V23_03720 [Streptomyces sp. VNUA116]|uniref:hypothetical protein n=1 Tax=Streptomyces sp. VNUA116 TaxID=3062449 RepID=UPI00267643C2|nr:hypothetical protein [Streptomyces sp. VNUA116]WKU43255.1 hypothetical protein Q3V23_03720 [Streptomyces sp. VNUA116]